MIKATANSGCGVEKYSSNSASVVATATDGARAAAAAAAAPAAACNPAGDFVADAASRGHGATLIGRSAAQMRQQSSNFSSRIMYAMCYRTTTGSPMEIRKCSQQWVAGDVSRMLKVSYEPR